MSERSRAERVHHEGTGCGRWCAEVRQIGAWWASGCGHGNDIHVPPFAGIAGTDSFDRYPDFPTGYFMSDVSGRSGRTASPAKKRLLTLSTAFLTQEDAAYWVHSRIPLGSDREHGSVILLRPDGKFVATAPVPGDGARAWRRQQFRPEHHRRTRRIGFVGAAQGLHVRCEHSQPSASSRCLSQALSGPVATHSRPTGLAAWDAKQLFPLDAKKQSQLPQGYQLEGFDFYSRPDPVTFPPVQPWRYANFSLRRNLPWLSKPIVATNILARSGRFVVTEPLEGGIVALSRRTVFPSDNEGRPVLPDDCSVHAHYVSHEALSQLDPSVVERGNSES